MSEQLELASADRVCGVAGCRADAATRITLPDGRRRVVCLTHATEHSEVSR